MSNAGRKIEASLRNSSEVSKMMISVVGMVDMVGGKVLDPLNLQYPLNIYDDRRISESEHVYMCRLSIALLNLHD